VGSRISVPDQNGLMFVHYILVLSSARIGYNPSYTHQLRIKLDELRLKEGIVP